jgi:membrane fusion protein (multidrug efflux system)
MGKHKVLLIAVAGLIVAGVVAYFVQRGPAPGTPAAGKGPASGADAKGADAKGADAKGADAKGAGKGEPKKGSGPVPVEVVTLVPRRAVEELQAVGTMRSNQSVLLRPEVTGRVAVIGFRDGAVVKRGQLLVGLDASLNEAEVAQSRAELELARANLKRTADLASKNFVSGSAQDTAQSNVTVLEAKLQLSEARLAKMRIVAPFDGVVGIRAVAVGDVVRDGTDLVNIEDIRRLKVDFRLPERAFTQLKVGLPVEVVADALPGGTYKGQIEAINPRIDAAGRSLEVRAELPNSDGRLRPGMFARVRVAVGDRADALLVPEEAIVPQGEGFLVYKVEGDVARRVPVRLGVRRDGQVELLGAVKAGDRIVTAGVRVQRDGQPVRVVSGSSSAAREGAAPKAADDASKAAAAPGKP